MNVKKQCYSLKEKRKKKTENRTNKETNRNIFFNSPVE